MFKSKSHTKTATEVTPHDVSKALALAIAPQVVKILIIWGFGYACRRTVRDMAVDDPKVKAMLERMEAR